MQHAAGASHCRRSAAPLPPRPRAARAGDGRDRGTGRVQQAAQRQGWVSAEEAGRAVSVVEGADTNFTRRDTNHTSFQIKDFLACGSVQSGSRSQFPAGEVFHNCGSFRLAIADPTLPPGSGPGALSGGETEKPPSYGETMEKPHHTSPGNKDTPAGHANAHWSRCFPPRGKWDSRSSLHAKQQPPLTPPLCPRRV